MVRETLKKELCILHIGMPKTGSSTLQEALYQGIGDSRVSYTHLSEFNQGCILYGMFMTNPESFHYFASRGWSPSQIKVFSDVNQNLLVEGFKKCDTSIEILSGEDLFHFSHDAIVKLKQFLEPYFQKIVVVGYVRPVKSFLESAFQQLVKYHNQGDLNFTNIYHPYKNFKRYDDVFGRDNVMLLKYDTKDFPSGDIVLDFCHKLHLNTAKATKKSVNEALSQEAIAILFTYHYHKELKTDFGIKTHQLYHRLVEQLREFGTTRLRFSQELIDLVVQDHLDDYTWIRERMSDALNEQDEASNGIGCETDLFNIAIHMIDSLVSLAGVKHIRFELNKNSETVAKLIDTMMQRIAQTVEYGETSW
jgi:hypothetical protein